MAPKKMLIDALHPEETRVAVLDGSRLEDIDVEVASRKQLKGNIYLAKVTRVEPSLQAAFVEYGGNRHGFLAFNEIHPDYYQIPVADREALVAEHDADERAFEARRLADPDAHADADAEPTVAHHGDLEVVGGDDVEEVEIRRPTSRRNYKIQEVIKRRQIMLVQVVKEERGNKGAAVTTYMSLAGRYCVLMPNTARGGGISRKIPTGTDRKRLKSMLSDLAIPEGMGVIVRTAGAERSKAEIRRDYDYLMRLWDNVRRITLESIAPVLVYEEANLIKRAIRDLYSREIDEIIVEGEEGYKTARNFMKLIIPSHLKRVKKYEDQGMPLFHRYQVESQQDSLHTPTVRLKSGGYIVINPTEALVSIDVNSGRSTRERNIEETALRTNIEACDEIARQLRLRDLAGLIVIDFIDMEVGRNRAQVERRLKEAMRVDRARIQLGRISAFGLMELSRQRLRPSVIETSFEVCTHCGGAGVRRSTDSTALHLLRAIEEEGIRKRSLEAIFQVPSEVALYLLNHKREMLSAIERRYEFKVMLAADDTLVPPDFRIERTKVRGPDERAPVVGERPVAAAEHDEPDEGEEREEHEEHEEREAAAMAGEEPGKKRRRRRSRRHKRGDEAEAVIGGPRPAPATFDDGAAADEEDEGAVRETGAPTRPETAEEEQERTSKRRRRGKRGGRRRRGLRPEDRGETGGTFEATGPEAETPQDSTAPAFVETDAVTLQVPAAPAFAEPDAVVPVEIHETPAEGEAAPVDAEAKPKRRRRVRKPKETEDVPPPVESADAPVEPAAEPSFPMVATEAPEAERVPAVRELVAVATEVADAVMTAEKPGEGPKEDTKERETQDAKTEVIDVDSPEVRASIKPRRGWWRRP
ncbi:Rne/Rng family ribonuclease [Shumkonia mesophila]|uniref:Rne/Rng family ribonuclease n=1 Tax=Shumkonia mesophila TaxID=2838854 RepID=UPI0029352E01|nr:Rne/Rng family ribonuclease [Shumkonia mesophila]